MTVEECWEQMARLVGWDILAEHDPIRLSEEQAAARDLMLAAFERGVNVAPHGHVCPEVLHCRSCTELEQERARIAALGQPAEAGEGSE